MTKANYEQKKTLQDKHDPKSNERKKLVQKMKELVDTKDAQEDKEEQDLKEKI